MKRIILLLFVITLFGAFVLGDAITNYKVPYEVPLGLNVTATGTFLDADGNAAAELCSFYFFDDAGVLVKRATDQYSTTTGRFAMSGFPITEPVFKRDTNYRLRSECGSATADANFRVVQRETIAHTGTYEWEYLTNRENLDTILIWGAGITFLAFVAGLLWMLFKWGRRR